MNKDMHAVLRLHENAFCKMQLNGTLGDRMDVVEPGWLQLPKESRGCCGGPQFAGPPHQPHKILHIAAMGRWEAGAVSTAGREKLKEVAVFFVFEGDCATMCLSLSVGTSSASKLTVMPLSLFLLKRNKIAHGEQ